MLRGLKQTLCAPGPKDPTETETELCLSVSCGGMGQQWTAAGIEIGRAHVFLLCHLMPSSSWQRLLTLLYIRDVDMGCNDAEYIMRNSGLEEAQAGIKIAGREKYQ